MVSVVFSNIRDGLVVKNIDAPLSWGSGSGFTRDRRPLFGRLAVTALINFQSRSARLPDAGFTIFGEARSVGTTATALVGGNGVWWTFGIGNLDCKRLYEKTLETGVDVVDGLVGIAFKTFPTLIAFVCFQIDDTVFRAGGWTEIFGVGEIKRIRFLASPTSADGQKCSPIAFRADEAGFLDDIQKAPIGA